jgi:hypothetical protein
MNAIWLKVKEYAKTVAAFLAGIAVSVVINLINGSTPWPRNTSEWIQLAVASFGPAIATALSTNKITQRQLDNDPHVIGGVVVPEAPVTTSVLGVRNNPPIPPPVGGYRDPYA